MNADLIDYYARRAAEYESVYHKPERQADLARLKQLCATLFRGHQVLELSCGTGFWTQVIAGVAESVVACDINQEVLDLARSKDWRSCQVRFLQADSYDLPDFGETFSAAFAGFWWSHVPKRKLVGFLTRLQAKLPAGALVVFIDNRYVPGSSTPVSRTDEYGDSYQQRKLQDGIVYEVLKNFPTSPELESAVATLAASVDLTLFEYYWVLCYRIKG